MIRYDILYRDAFPWPTCYILNRYWYCVAYSNNVERSSERDCIPSKSIVRECLANVPIVLSLIWRCVIICRWEGSAALVSNDFVPVVLFGVEDSSSFPMVMMLSFPNVFRPPYVSIVRMPFDGNDNYVC